MKIFLFFRELTCSVDGIFNSGGPVGKEYYGGLYRNHLSFIEDKRWADIVEDAKNIFDVEFIATIKTLQYFVAQDHYKQYKKLLVQCDNYEAVHFANEIRLATTEDRVKLIMLVILKYMLVFFFLVNSNV